ncbi:MAG: ABC transporter permease subunit [Microthrixaceae bacterium]
MTTNTVSTSAAMTSPAMTSPAMTPPAGDSPTARRARFVQESVDKSDLRSFGDDLRATPGALRSEWIKLASLRANKVIFTTAPLVGGLVAWALAASDTEGRLSASELFIFPLPLIATLAFVTGILMFTAEAQHGTVAVMLTARPARWVIVSAKTVVATMVGLALGATAMAAGFGGALLGGVDVGDGSGALSRALWALLYIALAAVIGLGVGMIVRHSAGAISALLMWSFVIESLFAPALPEGVVHFLPFSAGYRLLDAGPEFQPPVSIVNELTRPQYALIFGSYALVSLAIGTVLLYRRDSN